MKKKSTCSNATMSELYYIDTYSFFPQAPLGALSSTVEEREGKYTSLLMSGACFDLKFKMKTRLIPVQFSLFVTLESLF